MTYVGVAALITLVCILLSVRSEASTFNTDEKAAVDHSAAAFHCP